LKMERGREETERGGVLEERERRKEREERHKKTNKQTEREREREVEREREKKKTKQNSEVPQRSISFQPRLGSALPVQIAAKVVLSTKWQSTRGYNATATNV
jgi:hypothetical protein